MTVDFFSPITPKYKYFYFPEVNTSHYIMKYTVPGSLTQWSKSLYILIFNFNRFPETHANVPFWDIAKSSRQFQTTTVCMEWTL